MTTTKKPTAKKKATKKKAAAKKPAGAGILETIRAELSEEFDAREAVLVEENEGLKTKMEAIQEELAGLVDLKKNHEALTARIEELQRKNRDLANENSVLKNSAAAEDRLAELEAKEASITEAMANFEKEREANVNEIVNTRTERMKAKLDEQLAERSNQLVQQILIGQDVQTREVYHKVAEVLRESRVPAIVLNQSLDLIKQTLLLEQRQRLGVDAKPEAAPTPPTPPTDADESSDEEAPE